MGKMWSASEARAKFSDVLDNASSGQIVQIERQSDGAEFVLMSRDLFMSSRPSLAHFLAKLDTGLSEEQTDVWLETMREVRGL
jgi:hypothetical protein